jgi:hypothetical protein
MAHIWRTMINPGLTGVAYNKREGHVYQVGRFRSGFSQLLSFLSRVRKDKIPLWFFWLGWLSALGLGDMEIGGKGIKSVGCTLVYWERLGSRFQLAHPGFRFLTLLFCSAFYLSEGGVATSELTFPLLQSGKGRRDGREATLASFSFAKCTSMRQTVCPACGLFLFLCS